MCTATTSALRKQNTCDLWITGYYSLGITSMQLQIFFIFNLSLTTTWCSQLTSSSHQIAKTIRPYLSSFTLSGQPANGQQLETKAMSSSAAGKNAGNKRKCCVMVDPLKGPGSCCCSRTQRGGSARVSIPFCCGWS